MTEESNNQNLMHTFIKSFFGIDEVVSFSILATDSKGGLHMITGGRHLEVYGSLEYAHRRLWLQICDRKKDLPKRDEESPENVNKAEGK